MWEDYKKNAKKITKVILKKKGKFEGRLQKYICNFFMNEIREVWKNIKLC